MATFNKFNQTVEDIAHGAHDFSADTLVVALTNTAPTASDSTLADITEISYTDLSSRELTVNASGQTSGVYALEVADLTLNATGTVPEFRYVVIYNFSTGSDRLIGWYDRESAVNLEDGDSFTVEFTDAGVFFEIS